MFRAVIIPGPANVLTPAQMSIVNVGKIPKGSQYYDYSFDTIKEVKALAEGVVKQYTTQGYKAYIIDEERNQIVEYTETPRPVSLTWHDAPPILR